MRKSIQTKRIALVAIMMLTATLSASAGDIVNAGAVNYTWGSVALYEMTAWVLTMMYYVSIIIYALASITALVNALQVYIKMQLEGRDVIKNIVMCVGSCIFLVAATTILPSFFGVEKAPNAVMWAQ